MADVHVSINHEAFKRELNVFAKQIAYATAKAVNYAALAGQKAERERINVEFIVRRKSFIDRSVKVKFAKKESLTAEILIEGPGGRDVLSQHEGGGRKTPTSGEHIAIPLDAVRTDAKKVVPLAKRPGNLKDAFKATTDDGKKFLLMRKGRGKNAQTLPAYRLVRAVTLKPKLQFKETVSEAVVNAWGNSFNRAWDEAIKTALK